MGQELGLCVCGAQLLVSPRNCLLKKTNIAPSCTNKLASKSLCSQSKPTKGQTIDFCYQ